MPSPALLRPERSAHAAIRGYLYQTCLGVVRWLELGEGETLVVEGDEDLDRLLVDGTAVSEQVKAYHGRLGVRDRAVRDSLRAFAVAWAALRRGGGDRRFVFTTTAEKRRPRTGDLDVVAAWSDPERRDEVVDALQALLPETRDPHLTDALAWLDGGPGRWSGFVDAVEWHFEAAGLDGVRADIEDGLRERGLAPTAAHVDRLVAELLRASSEKRVERRCRTAADLDELLRTLDRELARWSATPRAVTLRALFDEVEAIARLLRDGTRDLPRDPSPGHLLTAAHEVVPFHRELRRGELDDLAAWCDGEARAGVRLWTGEGGTGKTRLMIEACRQLRARGWHAGFLKRHLGGDALEPLVAGKAPRLVVVDYAETRQDVVRPLLYKVATAAGGPRCRVVLLARREADWWRILKESDADVGQLIADSPPPRRLGPLDAGRGEAFREAEAAFAQAAGGDGGEVGDGEGAGLDRLLYVHMAALAAVGGERVEDARDALDKTLEREGRYWQREVDGLGLDGSLRRHLRAAAGPALAALTLVGGAGSRGEARRLVEAATGVSAPRADLGDTLVRFLGRLYGGSQDAWAALEPDLLGEELVAACLDRDPELLDRVLELAGDRGRSAALTVLTRLAGRRPEEERWLRRAFAGHAEELAEPALAVAVEIGDPVGRVLADFAGEVSDELAKRLMARCDADDYQRSVPLREVACEVTRRHLAVCRERWPEPGEEQLRELSRAANNLGNRLSDLGRREEALEASRESVEMDRRLAEDRPDAFLSDLAISLNNLGKMLSDLGRREDALEATQEAVDLRRQLAEARPDAFLPVLATSLNNLGNRLSDLGRREDALEATREAVDLLRQLAEARPDAFLPDLALSLSNLGNRLSKLGRRETALKATQETVELFRQLAESRPDAFLPNLALSLNNLGNRLSDLGRREDALEVTREAVDLRRRLAEDRPDAFLPDLATSLNNLGNRFSDLGRREDALAASEEAVRTLAPFFERLPAAFAGWMRIMVDNYRKLADAAGRPVDGELLGPILAALERAGEDG